MQVIEWVRMAIWSDSQDRLARLYASTLEETGIQFEPIESLTLGNLSQFDVLLICGQAELSPTYAQAIQAWVQAGGQLVVSGSSAGLNELIGVVPTGHRHSHAQLKPVKASDMWPSDIPLIKVFGQLGFEASTADPIASGPGCPCALSHSRVGQGSVWFFAAHVGRCLQTMRMGRSVETGGIGPTDGTAELLGEKLRAEDGTNLCFEKDRFKIAGEPTPIFAIPYADAVREVWLRCVLQALSASGKAYLWIWPYPKNAEAVSVWAFEGPANADERISRLNLVLDPYGVKPSWMSVSPGFESESHRAIRRSGGEPGLLFSSQDKTEWTPERLHMERIASVRGSGFEDATLTRPENGEWWRWDSFYALCDQAGVALSGAKGGRQPGTGGFLFGTSVPFRPNDRIGQPYEVYECPYQIFLPGFASRHAETIVGSVRKRHGCLHVAGDLMALAEAHVEDDLRRIANLALNLGVRPFLASDLAMHLRGRHQLRILLKGGDAAQCTLTSPVEMSHLTVMFGNILEPETAIGGRKLRGETVTRFGVRVWANVVLVEPKLPVTIEVDGACARAA